MNQLNQLETEAKKIFLKHIQTKSGKKGINEAAKLWEADGLTRDAAQHRSRKFYHSNKWKENSFDGTIGVIPQPIMYYTETPITAGELPKGYVEEAEQEPAQIIPISIKLETKEVKKVDSSGLKRAIILPDIQMGYRRDWRTGQMVSMHDRQCLDLALQIAADIQPDHVVYNGDNLDLAEASIKFLKSPDFIRTTQSAGIELAWHYAKMRQVCGNDTVIDAIAGNHDERLQIALTALMPFAAELRPVNKLDGPPLTSMETFLGLADINVNYHGPYPFGKVWINDRLAVHHGTVVRTKSGATVSAVSEKLRHSESFGHVHRMESCVKTVWEKAGPKHYMAFSAGCLCKLNPGLVPAVVPENNWQNGIAVVDYEEGDGMFHVDLVLFAEGKALYRGKIYTAREEADIVKDLETDTGWNFYYGD